jgi:hypothetical protein
MVLQNLITSIIEFFSACISHASMGVREMMGTGEGERADRGTCRAWRMPHAAWDGETTVT